MKGTKLSTAWSRPGDWPNRVEVTRAYTAQRNHFFGLYERTGASYSLAEAGHGTVGADWRAGRGLGPALNEPGDAERREE